MRVQWFLPVELGILSTHFGLGGFAPVLVALVFRAYNIWLYCHLLGMSALTPTVFCCLYGVHVLGLAYLSLVSLSSTSH